MRRKVLIVTYYWPPSGGPGVQRVLKFVKFLPQLGWDPVILTVDSGEYPVRDETLVKDIPKGVPQYKTKSIEPYKLFKFFSGRSSKKGVENYLLDQKPSTLNGRIAQFIRQNFFIPDARVGWYPYARKKGMEIIEREKPDIIFSSSPPHSLQLAARSLHRSSGIPWVADFRDPWTQAFWDKGLRRNPISNRINLNFEKSVIREASAITVVSKGMIDLLSRQHSEKFSVISNGYDKDDFTSSNPSDQFFRILYTGHIARSQNPLAFFKAISSLDKDVLAKCRIEFYGKSDPSVHRAIVEYNLEKHIHLLDYVAHHEATALMQQAHILLLLIPADFGKGILTGKLFEYLATGNFILGLGDEQDDAADVLRKTNSGIMKDYKSDVKHIILAQFKKWEQGEKNMPDWNEIEAYSRQNLTKRLAAVFDTVSR